MMQLSLQLSRRYGGLILVPSLIAYSFRSGARPCRFPNLPTLCRSQCQQAGRLEILSCAVLSHAKAATHPKVRVAATCYHACTKLAAIGKKVGHTGLTSV